MDRVKSNQIPFFTQSTHKRCRCLMIVTTLQPVSSIAPTQFYTKSFSGVRSMGASYQPCFSKDGFIQEKTHRWFVDGIRIEMGRIFGFRKGLLTLAYGLPYLVQAIHEVNELGCLPSQSLVTSPLHDRVRTEYERHPERNPSGDHQQCSRGGLNTRTNPSPCVMP